MSHVAAVIVMMSVLNDEGPDSSLILSRLNDRLGRTQAPGFVWIDSAFGGSKHPQASIAAAGVNYLNIPDFLAHLRAVPWAECEIRWVQVAIQDEHDAGFGLVEIFRQSGTAWSESP